MHNKILAILPEDFDLGFKLIGVDTQVCLSPGQAKECLEKELAARRCSLILIDENYLLSFDSRFNKKVQESMMPLVMAIPLRRTIKQEEKASDYFLKMVQSAIGYEIRIK